MQIIHELSYVFLLFFIYSIVGYICEVIYNFLFNGFKIRDTGFLYGPYCPIYGFGSLIVILFLKKYENDLLVLFFLSVIFTTILEYITSYIMEKMFHNKWWDYSDKKFNINGRVCLEMSGIFGLLSVFVVYFVNPSVSTYLKSIPTTVTVITSSILFLVMFVDMLKTSEVAFGLKKKIKEIRKEISSYLEQEKVKFEENQKRLKEEIYNITKDGLEKININKDKKVKLFKDMLSKTPTYNSGKSTKKYNLSYIKEYFNRNKNK